MFVHEQRKEHTCNKNTYIIRLPWTWPKALQAVFVGSQYAITSQAEQVCTLCLQNPACNTGEHGQGPFGSTTYFILEIIFGHCTFKNLLWLSTFWDSTFSYYGVVTHQGNRFNLVGEWAKLSGTECPLQWDIEDCVWYKERCTGQNRGWYMVAIRITVKAEDIRIPNGTVKYCLYWNVKFQRERS